MTPEPPQNRMEPNMTLSHLFRQQNQCPPLPHRLSVEKLGIMDAEALSDANL